MSHATAGKPDIDPTHDRDPANWLVEADPPPDTHLVTFMNSKIGYFSYNPPRGFSAEEIMAFENASKVLTLEKAERLIKKRDEQGTLEVVYDG